MNWEKLFEQRILERGYDYYCEDAVEQLDIFTDLIRAEVMGTEDYKVEISLDCGEVTEMYCSCPYASDGRNCKHMAAVLYAWSKGQKNAPERKREEDADLFIKVHTSEAYRKKEIAIQKLVESVKLADVKSFLVSVLAEDEKRLIRFRNIVNKQVGKEDIKRYIRQIDGIAKRYMGKDLFINYYAADGFVSELEDILGQDVGRMMDNGQYRNAFELMNYIFTLIGDVSIDDSGGGIVMLTDQIYQLWLEILTKGTETEKLEMFQWFTTRLDGSLTDYLEEYIERIIMEEFQEEGYRQKKLIFIEEMIGKSETLAAGWSRDYNTGKWAARYLDLMQPKKRDKAKVESFCRAHWKNSAVRKYYIDLCIKWKEYELALKTLNESIVLDKDYRGLVSNYGRKKKDIYLLQGDREAYREQLWMLVQEQEAGNLELYRELKEQYEPEEWIQKREKVFEKLPKYAQVEKLYQEEKLYDRLLEVVISSPGLHRLQEYVKVLKKEYPEQILRKYKVEVNQMASRPGDRKKYRELAGLLRDMKKIQGGAKAVEEILTDWRSRYRNRPAMMEELKRL